MTWTWTTDLCIQRQEPNQLCHRAAVENTCLQQDHIPSAYVPCTYTLLQEANTASSIAIFGIEKKNASEFLLGISKYNSTFVLSFYGE